MRQVYAVRCPSYDQARQQMERLLSLCGGMAQFAQPGEDIVVKVNLLRPAPPEKAVSTHPAVAGAVSALIAAQGARAVLCDSPGSGYPYTESTLRSLYRQCGMEEAAERSGASLNFDLSSREVALPQGRLIRRAEVISPVLDADGVINVCKLKTHVFMGMTGAVKNHFGIIPGLGKVGFHAKLRDRELFARMLLDLCGFVSARLHIMDAVVAMEGDGPGESGRPRPVGWLLASEDAVALDYVACRMIGQEDSPVLRAAESFWGFDPLKVELVGASMEELFVPNFLLPCRREGMLGKATGLGAPVQRLLASALSSAPRIDHRRCVGCGICERSCPQGAISLAGGRAAVDRSRCIRCYCCHELCPQAAVLLRHEK